MTYKHKGINISDILQGTAENIVDNSSNSIVYYNFPGSKHGKTITITQSGVNVTSNLSKLANDIYKPYNLQYRIPVFFNGAVLMSDASLLRVAKYRDFDISGQTFTGANFLPNSFPTTNVEFKAILIGPGGAGGGGSGGKENDGEDTAGSGGGSGFAGKVVMTPIFNYNSTFTYSFFPGSSGAGGHGGATNSNSSPGGPGGTGGKGTATIFKITFVDGSTVTVNYSADAGNPGNGGNQTTKGGSTGGTGGNPGKNGIAYSNAAVGGLGGAPVSPGQQSDWVTISGYGGSGAGGQGGTAYSGGRGGNPGSSGQPGLVRVIYYYNP